MKRRKQKVTAWLMAFVMVFSIAMVPEGVAKAEGEQNSARIHLRKATAVSIDENTATITYENGQATVSGNELSHEQNDNWDYGDNNIGTMHTLLTTSDAMTFTLNPVEGYKAYFWENGQREEIINNTYTISGLTGDTNRDVEFTFESESGGGGNNQPQNIPTTIKIGNTILVNENEVVQDASVPGVTIGEQNGFFSVTLQGCNSPDSVLYVEGAQHLALLIEENSENTLKGISIGENVSVEADGAGTLTIGSEGVSGVGNGGRISFQNDIILYVGTEETSVTTGFKNLDLVRFGNYEFHSRDKINNYIYATTEAFHNVTAVEVVSSRVYAEADTLFTGDTKAKCSVFQEGEIRTKGDAASGVDYVSKYYSSYPDNTQPVQDLGHDLVVGECITEFTIPADDSSVSGADKASYTHSNEDGITVLKSNDPILYSVSYQVDDGFGDEYGDPHAGMVFMDGFEKGFYTEDGTGGRFEAWIAAGESVDVTILPDSGYQYIKNTLNINGQNIDTTAGEERGTYSFEMPANAGHICAGFIKTDDVVNVSSDAGVGSASITGTEHVIEYGNAKLDVSRTEVSEAEADSISAQTGNEQADYTYLDLTLSEYVVKNYDSEADNQEAWETKQTELESPVQITLGVLGNIDYAVSYEVIRLHDGVAEKLPVTQQNIFDQTITFETDKFSTYAIAAIPQSEQEPFIQTGLNVSTPQSGTYKQDGNTVTIENLVVDGESYAELCLFGAEYGKTPMTLIVKGTNKAKWLIFDTQVTVICEKGASLTFTESDFVGYDNTGGYTLGANTVLEGKVFKYQAADSTGGGTSTPAESAKTDDAKTPATKGSRVKTKDAKDTSNYVVTSADGKNPTVEYKGDSNKSKKSVTIPATVTDANGVTYKVTKIADGALSGNKKVTTVTMGANITSIGKNAFKNCTKLNKVTVGKGVTTIGNSAFSGCKKLKTVTIGAKVTTIGDSAFAKCSALTKVTIPKKVTKIGKSAFDGCKKLKTLTIKSTKLSSKNISKNAFKGITKGTVIKVPKSKKSAYTKLFRQKGLSKKVKIK